MAGNKNLNNAARAKKDEFYTRIEDINNELYHYQKFFAGKTVLCNCDDPYESDFFKYFAIKFNELGLKKLIATCYAGSPIVQTELDFWGTVNENPTFDKRTQAIRLDVNELRDWNGDRAVDLLDVQWLLKNNRNSVTYLKGDGDFRSQECIAALKEADVVVTNPPFSLFREYVAQLVEYDKKFLIIGNKNAVTYKEIFPLIMQNKIWTGYRPWTGGMWFISVDEDNFDKIVDGKKLKNASAVWFTNIDIVKRHEDILLYMNYSPEQYPRYDNYDAIEVSKTAEIPMDYDGVMGVPITFLDKYNPDQFEIVGCTESEGVGASNGLWHDDSLYKQATINGKKIYKRLFIRRRQHNTEQTL